MPAPRAPEPSLGAPPTSARVEVAASGPAPATSDAARADDAARPTSDPDPLAVVRARRRAIALDRAHELHRRRVARRAVGGVVVVAAVAAAAIWRQRLDDVAGSWSPWWSVVAVVAVVPAVALLVRQRPRTPKSAAHPALLVRRGQHWPRRQTQRPLGRRPAAPNVFIDADSFAAAAWPGADLDIARRWTVDASARVAARFGTRVAVLVGPDAPQLPDRDGVRVVRVPDDGSIRDALWEVVAPVEVSLMMLFVTDDDTAALAAEAHGAQVMPCGNWMALVDA